MRKSKREGNTQSYNAQTAVDADGTQLILANRVATCASDANELEPTLHAIPVTLGQPTTALADCGYVNREAFARLADAPRRPATLRQRPPRRRPRRMPLRVPSTR